MDGIAAKHLDMNFFIAVDRLVTQPQDLDRAPAFRGLVHLPERVALVWMLGTPNLISRLQARL